MDRITWLGIGFVTVGLLGYIIGVEAPYTGRELSLVAVLVGAPLLFVGGDGG